MLLKSTVQNIRPQVEAAQTISETKKDETSSDAGSTAPEGEIERSEEAPESLELSETEKGNIDKILTLLDEIRDPFQGQSTPAMIGMEYEGQLMIV
ncbi:Oidioi.mRNA.OKI2018_I69.chr2.g5972.t1.cds [Oikopleura dioica]|uniref:Oidioi.mRNA.OKI2018_I69.chr2.g5972.t1.cds n=1 Tax=Oikopleura dioica TaxID=34765 RepID=A0ABN7T8M1_OIKDI|nr:Oidioi.mRNA.OKI2018_I69.chr2.g5972.t1.cds [Oikopleura dioica]